MIEKRLLTVDRIWTTAYELPEGGLTRDYSAARWAIRVRKEPDGIKVKAAARELLRVDRHLEVGPPTPARVAVIEELVEFGVLPKALGDASSELHRLDDAAWRSVSELSRAFEPVSHDVSAWNIELVDHEDLSVELPVNYDLDSSVCRDYPSNLVGRIVRALARDGWSMRRHESIFDIHCDELEGRRTEFWRGSSF